MKFLRNVAGYTLKDQIRNTVIRNELKIFIIDNRIQNNLLNWIHHVGRMEPECIPKQLMYYTPRGEAQDPLDAPSHVGRINLFNRGTERIKRSKP
jgi:hypothetical protein